MSEAQQRAWDTASEWPGPGGESPPVETPVAESPAAPIMVEPPAASAAIAEPAPREQFFAGQGVRFKGELFSCDDLHLSGVFEGAARARKLTVARGGVFNGDCTVEEAEIDGAANGNITVTGMLTVRAGGVVKGKISYGEIALERGAQVEGELSRYVAPAVETPVVAAVAPLRVAMDPVLVELSAEDIVAPAPRVLTAEPDAAPRKRFGIFGGRR